MSESFSFYKRYAKCEMCKSNQELDGVRFHALPVDMNRARAWLQVAGKNLDNETIHQGLNRLFFCERHFHLNDYYNEKKTRLLPHAVPHATSIEAVQVHSEPTESELSKSQQIIFYSNKF